MIAFLPAEVTMFDHQTPVLYDLDADVCEFFGHRFIADT
jgi:hypothetical protein